MFVMYEKMFTVQFNMTGEISLQEIFISEQKTVGDLREKLLVSSPGSKIVIRNHLLELREDAKLADVTEEGDTLTVFKGLSEADIEDAKSRLMSTNPAQDELVGFNIPMTNQSV